MNKLDFKNGEFVMTEKEEVNPFEAGIIQSLEEAEAENEIKPEAHKHVEMIRNEDNQVFVKINKHGWQELSVANQIYMVEALLNNLREIEDKA